MINIDNKTYRNLEEQVGYNTDKVNELSSRLNRQFVDINGIVPDVASLPKDLPNGSYYLVGVSEPYDLYYHVYDRWVNLGVFTFKGDQGPAGAVGPQGEKGPQGERGIEGPMGRPGQTGPQGLRGPQGEQGPQGPKGDKGEEGTIFYVVTKLNSVNELPAAEATPTTNAYLVKSAKQDTQGNPIYDLYIISKKGQTQSWINVGAMTGTNTRIIEIKAPASAKNGTLTLNQLEQIKEPVVNMIQLGESTFLPASHIQGYYLYRCLTDDKMLVLSINEANGAWTLTSYVINLPDVTIQNLREEIRKKQDILVSGTNIKKIDNNDITGSGNLSLNYKQDTLISGTNIKTVNGYSLLGEGNITIGDTVAPSSLPKATTTSLGAVKVGNGLEVDSEGVLSTKDTSSITKEVICTHKYEITGNTGDEHGLAVEDQQMLIKRIEGQTKVVYGYLANSNAILKSSGRNLIDISKTNIRYPEVKVTPNSIILDSNIDAIFDSLSIYNKSGDYQTWIGLNGDSVKITDISKQIDVTFKTKTQPYKYYGVRWNVEHLAGFNVYVQGTLSSDKKSITDFRIVYQKTPYEPFKEDTIDGIGSLGQWDYDDLIAQKGIRQTSDIVTLNGSEGWYKSSGGYYAFKSDNLLTINDVYTINIVANNLTGDTADRVNNGLIDNSISMNGAFISIRKNDLTSVELLKTWLAAHPIQLVYKKATPTIVDINLPNGMAVYNGGLQSQIGQVPYRLTKQYNLSQKAQILANIEIDREQQDQISELKTLLIPRTIKWETIWEGTMQNPTTIPQDLANKLRDRDAIYSFTIRDTVTAPEDANKYAVVYASHQLTGGVTNLIGQGFLLDKMNEPWFISLLVEGTTISCRFCNYLAEQEIPVITSISKLTYK